MLSLQIVLIKIDTENEKGDLACERSLTLSSLLVRLPVIQFWGLVVLGMDREQRHPARVLDGARDGRQAQTSCSGAAPCYACNLAETLEASAA